MMTFPLLVLFPLLQHSFQLSVAQNWYVWCNNSAGNYTANSPYANNLNTLLTSLTTTNTTLAYFSNLTIGTETHRLNAITFCRADLTPPYKCKSCLYNTARKIRSLCPNQKEAYLWNKTNCHLRYSSQPIFRQLATDPYLEAKGNNRVLDSLLFDDKLETLLQKLTEKAETGNYLRKYAYGMALKASDVVKVYAQVECTPDLTHRDCSDCLNLVIGQIHTEYMNGSTSGSMYFAVPSCYVRYDINHIYNPLHDEKPIVIPAYTSPPSDSFHSPSPTTISNNKVQRRLTIIACTIVGSIIIIVIIVFLMKWRKSKSKLNDNENQTLEYLQVKFEALKKATKEFSNENKLGQGGFGIVYKGKLHNGQEVAIKRLLRKSKHGEEQIKNEIMILLSLRHKNLVKLLGYCLEKEEKILIYELLPNGSLDKYIYDPIQRASLVWDMRYKIIHGIARGLLYLHEESRLRIIHRDLKAGNILLDAEFNPKIADFGMARLFNIDHTQTMGSKIVGTYGYMAPEYALHGYVSLQLDVFSFGVLVLEIISGQRVSFIAKEDSSEGLLMQAWKNWTQSTPLEIVDPTLSNNSSSQILTCIHIGLLCVQHNVADRPTMSSINLMLSFDSHSMPNPSPPGFYARKNQKPNRPLLRQISDQSTRISTDCSTNEASITELCPR